MASGRLWALAERIDAATPPGRDRTVDGLRALAILGVICGHWLVTALVARGGGLTGTSPLAAVPAFVPASWILQTLAIFFFVGGYSGASGYRGTYPSWLRARMGRLLRPIAVLLIVWIAVTAGLVLAGFPAATVRTLLTLMFSPLWFICVYAGLTAITPALLRFQRRLGAGAVIAAVIAVALVDLVRFGLDGPAWLGWINLPAGWLVPYLLGVAWADGAFTSWRPAAGLLAGGTVATILLVRWGGYPASMVGVPGAAISNLNPPSLAAVTFGVAQVGAALLIRQRLARRLRYPPVWAVVAVANLSAMTLFLWHQTAFMLVTVAGLGLGVLPGLHTAPTGPQWALDRLAWLPVFAVTLAVLCALFHRFERPRGSHRGLGERSSQRGEREQEADAGQREQIQRDQRQGRAEHHQEGAPEGGTPLLADGQDGDECQQAQVEQGGSDGVDGEHHPGHVLHRVEEVVHARPVGGAKPDDQVDGHLRGGGRQTEKGDAGGQVHGDAPAPGARGRRPAERHEHRSEQQRAGQERQMAHRPAGPRAM
jgi:hypothetical protein